MNPIIYCQYARKSSEAKERQALSIQSQKDEISDYCARENIEISSEFKLEEEKSAYKPGKRPVFTKMVDLIESGIVQGIVAWKPDRLCRNPREGGVILQLLQDGIIKEIRAVTGEIYTQDSDHLVLQIHFGMANQFSRNLSTNVKRGLKHKAKRGQYTYRAPIGYEGFGEAPNKNIRPHDFEGPLIAKAFELMSKGDVSLANISSYLEANGLKTKSGKKLSKSHLQAIFNTTTYYGYFKQGGELHKGNYEPLISKTLYDKAQFALHDRSKPKVRTWKPFLNGIIKCGECGAAITTSVKKKLYKRTKRMVEYRYNHCTHNKTNTCNQKPLTAEQLEVQLFTSISKIQIDRKMWKLGISLLKEKHQNQTTQNSGILKEYRTQLTNLESRLSGLINLRADNEISKEQFFERKGSVLNDQAKVRSLIKDFEQSARNWIEQAEQFLDVAFNCKDIINNRSAEEKRKLILEVGQNFLFMDGKLTFQMKKPYDVLLKPDFRINVMPDLDSNQD